LLESLRKQFSIPKPDGMVIERTAEDFTDAQVRVALEANLTLCTTTCLAAFQQFSERWRDPAAMLSDFPDGSFSVDLNARWRSQYLLAFAWIELRTGRIEDAKARLANWNNGLKGDTKTGR
jgi:hypothetical protein